MEAMEVVVPVMEMTPVAEMGMEVMPVMPVMPMMPVMVPDMGFGARGGEDSRAGRERENQHEILHRKFSDRLE